MPGWIPRGKENHEKKFAQSLGCMTLLLLLAVTQVLSRQQSSSSLCLLLIITTAGICIPNLCPACLPCEPSLGGGAIAYVREIRALFQCIRSQRQSRDSRALRLPCAYKWACSKFSSLTVGRWSCGCKAQD
ncbi:hypothetical protein M441DRAFT_206775 [Trichoderma asperellum CBS 433.97]|uniref:Uncharacterized protein n=1 Tax=Trichoderma asperellum (strain ATCC 204424 / CBS 433.97 / NBRC 101777) TaxID=1042311 RepID=A0A2T3ZME4_TRIA4|nr:hypothetical protein M441DRAFT_206775 [Trichoderma asperellum CBS 433.97]PTB45975.1 hypothetical protein M441DRAFT_206775 [Trichoderma asperellum CBS 433.97]